MDIYICLDCGHEFKSNEEGFTIHCLKCNSGETEPHRHPQEAKICSVCNGSGKVFVTVSDYNENGYEPCPNCESCRCCGKSILHFSNDIIPVYVAENDCSYVICYDCVHNEVDKEIFQCQHCGEWNRRAVHCINCGKEK